MTPGGVGMRGLLAGQRSSYSRVAADELAARWPVPWVGWVEAA